MIEEASFIMAKKAGRELVGERRQRRHGAATGLGRRRVVSDSASIFPRRREAHVPAAQQLYSSTEVRPGAGAVGQLYSNRSAAGQGTKVRRYNWHRAGSLGWPFPMIK